MKIDLTVVRLIGSWCLVKVKPASANPVIFGDILTGFSLDAQILLPLYEMWIKKDRTASRQQ